jgi:hypothetical protein
MSDNKNIEDMSTEERADLLRRQLAAFDLQPAEKRAADLKKIEEGKIEEVDFPPAIPTEQERLRQAAIEGLKALRTEKEDDREAAMNAFADKMKRSGYYK